MTKELNSKSEPKRKGRKKKDVTAPKGIGLFDHIKHIRTVQDPDYFKNLTDLDKKSFNHFVILRGLSMNPALLDDISTVFKYFDKIPSPQFYQLLIGGIIPLDHPKRFYPWIKSKKQPFNKQLIDLISQYFEISNKESTEYATLLSSTENGRRELEDICRDYGMNDKEVEYLMKGNDDE